MSNSKKNNKENTSKSNAENNQKKSVHPLKRTIKKGYKDKDSSKNRLNGADKEILEDQVHSATKNNNKVADKIQKNNTRE